MTEPETPAPNAAPLSEFLQGLNAREREILDGERRALAALLSPDPPPERVLEGAAHALFAADELGRRHLALATPSEQPACHAGCHFCCYLKVSATAAEVLALAAYLRQKAPHSVLERTRARAAEFAADPRIHSADAKAEARIPCAVLTESGTCGAYDARPIACRGWHSLDAESCRRWLDDDAELPPANVQWARDIAAIGLGLSAALVDVGLSGAALELTTALDSALRDLPED